MVKHANSDIRVEVPAHRAHTDVSAETEAAIGRIAIWAARLEMSITLVAHSILNPGNPGRGLAVTVTMSASGQIELCRRLLALPTALTPSLVQKINESLNLAKNALVERNALLHSSPVGSLRKGKASFISVNKAAQRHYLPEELDAIGMRLHEAYIAVFSNIFALVTTLDPDGWADQGEHPTLLPAAEQGAGE